MAKTEKISVFPIPGVEPGPPGWKPGILTARPYGNYILHEVKSIVIKLFVTVILMTWARFRWVTIFSEEQFYLNHGFRKFIETSTRPRCIVQLYYIQWLKWYRKLGEI